MSVARWAILWAALMLLLCMPAFAQEDTQEENEPSEGQYAAENGGNGAPGPDSECPGAEVVNTTTGNGNKQSPAFSITGDSFRITTTLVATGDPQFLFFSAGVEEQNGQNVTTVDREAPGTDSSIVNAGPGSFFLDILAANVDYTIVVEDCVDTQGNPPANNPGDPGDPGGVVPGTGNGKPLPRTGGVPLLFGAAAFALASALLARRILAP